MGQRNIPSIMYLNFLQGGVLYAVNDRTFNPSEWCIYRSANYAIIDLDIV